MDDKWKLIIDMLDIATLLKIKRQCEIYITYSIDKKQFNEKNGIKANAKWFGEMLEYVESVLVFKNFEIKESGGSKTENITSTMGEDKKEKTKKEKTSK